MTKVLFAVAMLAYSLVPARADPWPETYSGHWCLVGTLDDLEQYTKRHGDNCPDHEFVLLKSDGYEMDQAACKFISIKIAPKRAGWMKGTSVIHTAARCGEENPKLAIEKRDFFYVNGSLLSKVIK